jgi:hypothetical protein
MGVGVAVVLHPSGDGCLVLQVAALFSVQRAPETPVVAPGPSGSGRRVAGDLARGLIKPVRRGTYMNVMAQAAVTDNFMDEDLMTRRQVAYVFRVTSSAVAIWARRGRLPELRNEAGRPRYRRADVEALMRRDLRRRTR